MMDITFEKLVDKFGAYHKNGLSYCIEQSPYLSYVAGSTNGYVIQGETYYRAFGYDSIGNGYYFWWEIINPEAEDESDACDWNNFTLQPVVNLPASWFDDEAAR